MKNRVILQINKSSVNIINLNRYVNKIVIVNIFIIIFVLINAKEINILIIQI